MARCLIVANQTATDPRLIARVKGVATEVPETEFVLLVPATHIRHLLRRGHDDEAQVVAEARAAEAVQVFERAGVLLVAAKVGVEDPVDAIEAEVSANPGYDSIILSTLPTAQSRWMLANVPGKVRERFGLPVHLVELPPSQIADWGTLASDG